MRTFGSLDSTTSQRPYWFMASVSATVEPNPNPATRPGPPPPPMPRLRNAVNILRNIISHHDAKKLASAATPPPELFQASAACAAPKRVLELGKGALEVAEDRKALSIATSCIA